MNRFYIILLIVFLVSCDQTPYEDLDYNLGILSYIGDPPKDGQFAYYPETAGFKLRVRCRGKVTSHQWPKSQYP